MTRPRTVLALLLAFAAIGAATPALASASTAVGVNVTATSGDFFNSPKVIKALRAAKPAWVRVFLGWNDLEPSQGGYNSEEILNYARFFSKLPASTKVDIDVIGTPAWANAGGGPQVPPTDPADYAGFVNYLANAFHGRVAAWEVWSEEDDASLWSGTPTQYVALLKAAYTSIKAVQPHALVILGGLTGNDYAYLAQLYAAGARGYFDAVGVHTDTACNITSPDVYEFNVNTQTINQYFFLGVSSVHRVMANNGDGALPIYMTELGWSSTNVECETGAWKGQKLAGVSPQTQATYLQQAYHCLDQPQYSYVKAAFWFTLFDEGNSSDPLDNYGLLSPTYSPKPAYAAFEAESLHGDQLSGPCGDFSPPKITILRPTSGQRQSGPLRIAVEASDPGSGVREITIDLTKHSREHFVSKNFAKVFTGGLTWLSAKNLPAGPHTIKVVVTDKLGLSATTTISFVHTLSEARRHHAK